MTQRVKAMSPDRCCNLTVPQRLLEDAAVAVPSAMQSISPLNSPDTATATATATDSAPRHVVVVVYPDVMAMDVCGPMEAFAMANFLTQRRLYRLSTAAVSADPVRTSLGFSIIPEYALADLTDPIDTLLISGGDGQAAASHDSQLTGWLRQAAPCARRHGSICTGAFVLAASGLLDGKLATTHWAVAPLLEEHFPATTVEADRIFVRDGQTYTSAGISAGIDLALALIEEDHGQALALDVARNLVVFLKRSGGQSQFSTHLQAQFSALPPIRKAQQWALSHLAEDLSTAALAARVGMSERNFRRLFVAELGLAPRTYIEKIRLDAARRQMEDSSLPAQTVATRCSFGTVLNLRRVFLRHLGVTPQQYRARFQRGRLAKDR